MAKTPIQSVWSKNPIEQDEYRFRCADMGQTSCNWQASGTSEDEVMRQIEQHGREKHGIAEFTEELKAKARSLMQRIKAA